MDGWHRALYRASLLGSALVVVAVACGGSGGGETDGFNEPGGDTDLEPDSWVEHGLGSVGLELDESHAWVINVGQRGYDLDGDGWDDEYLQRASLVALTLDGESLHATDVLDASAGADRRISFPAPERAVYFEQVGYHTEHMVLIDTHHLQPLLERTVSGFFTGARSSPSRNYIVANDQLDGAWRLAMVHSSSLETALVPQDGFMPQGVWNRTSDRLWTVAMGLSPAWARVRRQRVDAVDEYETEIDVYLDGFGCDPKFDYSWVAVSPDDRWAVFPLWQGSDRNLTVIDQLDGTHRVIPGSGPVGFTPDGSAIVSYGNLPGKAVSWLYLTDPVTLESRAVLLSDLAVPQYYTVPNGNWVVIAAAGGSDKIIIYDWQTGETTSLTTPLPVGLEEFVARPSSDELWMVSQEQLFKLDLGDKALEAIATPGFAIRHVNVLPSRDALIFTEPTGGRVKVFDMATREFIAGVELADPLDGVVPEVPRKTGSWWPF